jgi:ribosomal-protein-alanine N-acetyltransferase
MTHRLRSPRPSDYDAIASWIPDAEQCARWGGPTIAFPFSGAELPRLIASASPIVSGEGSTPYSLVDDSDPSSELLGFGQLVRQDRATFRLARLIVAPTRRGCGLGAELCRLLIEKAQSFAEAESVTLFVFRDNAPAVHLYTKLGFVEAPPHPRAQVDARRLTSEVMAMQKNVTPADGSL